MHLSPRESAPHPAARLPKGLQRAWLDPGAAQRRLGQTLRGEGTSRPPQQLRGSSGGGAAGRVCSAQGAAQKRLWQGLRAEGAAQPGARIRQCRPGAQGARTQPRIRRSPGDRQKPGGPRTARTLLPQAEQISGPAPRESRALQAESSVVTAGADSKAPELATPTVVVPSGASQDKQPPMCLTVASPYKQLKHLSLSLAPGRGLSSSPMC